jgi:hypothetical protein
MATTKVKLQMEYNKEVASIALAVHVFGRFV